MHDARFGSLDSRGVPRVPRATRRGRNDRTLTLFEESPWFTTASCGGSMESSWDSPCHGSRFDAHGRVLNGSAISDLEPAG